MDESWFYPPPASKPPVLWCPLGVQFRRTPWWHHGLMVAALIVLIYFNGWVLGPLFAKDVEGILAHFALCMVDSWLVTRWASRFITRPHTEGLEAFMTALDDEHSALRRHMEACAAQMNANLKSGLPPFHGRITP